MYHAWYMPRLARERQRVGVPLSDYDLGSRRDRRRAHGCGGGGGSTLPAPAPEPGEGCHALSPPGEGSSSRACRYGAGCTRAGCRFAHPPCGHAPQHCTVHRLMCLVLVVLGPYIQVSYTPRARAYWSAFRVKWQAARSTRDRADPLAARGMPLELTACALSSPRVFA